MSDESQTEVINEETSAELIGDTNGPEYIVRYNLFNAEESIGGLFTLQTGHANLTLIERDGAGDTVIGGGNFAVNAGNSDANTRAGRDFQGDHYSFANPFDDKLDGFLGVDNSDWQRSGQAIFEQTVTPEQFQDVQDHIVSYTGDLYGDPIDVNYNVGASVLPLEDQHSCYSFTQDVFEVAGGEGRLIEQFSAFELAKVDNLIETVHGDIPKIPERIAEKAKDIVKDAADAVSDRAESAIENVREKTGIGSSDEAALSPEVAPAAPPIEEASLSTENEVSLYDAVETLTRDYAEIENAYQGGPKSPVHLALDHPSAPAMFENLDKNGVESIKADISPELSSEDRASNILIGGESATREAGLSLPEEQQELETQVEVNTSFPPPITHTEPHYEDDASLGH